MSADDNEGDAHDLAATRVRDRALSAARTSGEYSERLGASFRIDAEPFGLSVVEAMLAASAQMHVREAVQYVIQAILRATNGALNDDATVLCLDWHGGPVRERTTDSGANG